MHGKVNKCKEPEVGCVLFSPVQADKHTLS